ncbi:hypothetical protein DXX99_05390 [Ammonifex thiophilus]|uniref:Uncharacterized protein n=1 Tax=Ammonifex thiophilus TaxID=444093 RepID=A0A3D8P5C8_9THEO|nr:hypothetical protein DXX99_05390 [Ammonifex thiophilus]
MPGFLPAVRTIPFILNANDLSGLATVFYGTAILKLIGKESLLPRKDVLLFLQEVEPLALSYLEYCYYLTATHSLLPGKPNHPEELLSFVKKCACRQGGFARSPHPCGLPTLITTYQATFILSFLFNSKSEGTILV